MVQRVTEGHVPGWRSVHQQILEGLEESLDHHIAGSKQKGFVEDIEGCWAVAENIRRIGQLGDDPCPTRDHISTAI